MVTKKIQSGFSAILVVILMVVLAALVLGGIYYYTQIYQPKQYAKEAIPIYKDFQIGLVEIGSSPSVPEQGPSDIVQIAQRHNDVVEKTRQKLNRLKPPRKMKQIHGDFLRLLDTLNTFTKEMTAYASFLEKILASGRPEESLGDIQRNQRNLGNIQDEVRMRGEVVDQEFKQLRELYPEFE